MYFTALVSAQVINLVSGCQFSSKAISECICVLNETAKSLSSSSKLIETSLIVTKTASKISSRDSSAIPLASR